MDIEIDEQDRVLYLCLLDDKRLGQILRKNISSKHLASEVRQKLFKMCSEFYAKYKKSPGHDIISEIDNRIKQKKIKEEDRVMFEEYLLHVFSIGNFSEDRTMDKLDSFVKTRLVTGLSNYLLKMQDYFDIDPDKALKEIRATIVEADSILGKSNTESILYESDLDLRERGFVTKFGIDPIDRQLGGGLKSSNYVILQGFTGMGKSWCVNHLAKMAVRFGHTALVIPTEMSNFSAKLRFKMSFTGMTQKELRDRTDEANEQIQTSMNRGADIFLLSEEEKSMRVDQLPAIIEETEAKTSRRIELIMIDSADELLPPEARYKDKREENTAIHTYLKNLAITDNRCILSTAQVQRGGDKITWIGKSNVADNINKIRKATIAISISGKEEEMERGLYRMSLIKHSDGVEGARIWARRDFSRGQFVTTYARYNKIQYKEIMETSPIIEDRLDED